MQTSWLRLLATSSLVFIPVFAAAQPPPAAAVAPTPPRAEGSGEFAFVATSGNAATTNLGLTGELLYRPHEPWVLKWKAAFTRLESNDELETQSFTFQFRTDRELTPKLALFGQYDYLRSIFSGVEHRHTIGSGISYKVTETERQTLKIDGALGGADERRLLDDDRTSAAALAGANYVLKISPTTDLRKELRFEQALDDGSDWRAGNTLAVVTKINAIFSLSASNVIRYVHDPVATFERTDTITSVALGAKF